MRCLKLWVASSVVAAVAVGHPAYASQRHGHRHASHATALRDDSVGASDSVVVRPGYGYGGYARNAYAGYPAGGYGYGFGYGRVRVAALPYYYGTGYPYGYYQSADGYVPAYPYAYTNPYYGYGTGNYGTGLGY